MDIHLEGVEIEGEGVDLSTALNAFKTAKQRATLANHTYVSKGFNSDFTEEIVKAAERCHQMSTT